METSFDRAARSVGGYEALADRIDRSKQALSHWKGGKKIPPAMCVSIERVTGVRCEELRADLSWHRGPPSEEWPNGKPLLDVEAA